MVTIVKEHIKRSAIGFFGYRSRFFLEVNMILRSSH